MLRGLNELIGYSLATTDGDVGSVKDFYFEDIRGSSSWAIRYLIVETGDWLEDREVLLSPAVCGQVDPKGKHIPVSLTREQVRSSPATSEAVPISRMYEMELASHYGWPHYWGGGSYPTGLVPPIRTPAPTIPDDLADQAADAVDEAEHANTVLRSMQEAIGYAIQATDGEIGDVEDFLVEDESWEIRYLVVDTGNWLPGRKVLVALPWIRQVSWSDSAVYVDLTRDQIESSPSFDPSMPVSREYEVRLHDSYGRPIYWNEPKQPPGNNPGNSPHI